jgi:hypothetical protein
MQFSTVLVVFLISLNSFAADLSGRDSRISIFQQMKQGDQVRTSNLDLTSGFGGMMPDDLGIGPIDWTNMQVQIKLYNSGASSGVYSQSGLDMNEVKVLVANSRMLNRFIAGGIKVTLPSNPTTRDISEAAAKLEASNKPEILQMRIQHMKEDLDAKDDQLRTLRDSCRTAGKSSNKKEAPSHTATH